VSNIGVEGSTVTSGDGGALTRQVTARSARPGPPLLLEQPQHCRSRGLTRVHTTRLLTTPQRRFNGLRRHRYAALACILPRYAAPRVLRLRLEHRTQPRSHRSNDTYCPPLPPLAAATTTTTACARPTAAGLRHRGRRGAAAGPGAFRLHAPPGGEMVYVPPAWEPLYLGSGVGFVAA
jgi:hypothetical protein